MIMLVPVGEIDASAVKSIRRHVSETFGEASRAVAGILLPDEAWNQARGQFLAS